MHLNIALSLKNLKDLCLIIHLISYTFSETVHCDNYFIFFSKIKYSSLFKIYCVHVNLKILNHRYPQGNCHMSVTGQEHMLFFFHGSFGSFTAFQVTIV